MSDMKQVPLVWVDDSGAIRRSLGFVMLDEDSLNVIEPINQKLGVCMAVNTTNEIVTFEIFRHQVENEEELKGGN